MELKNISRPSESSHIEVEPVDTEKFIFDKANNEEKILLGLFFIALSLSWLATKLNRRKGSQREVRDSPVKPSKLTKFLVSLPCCGIAKLILTGICIIVTVVISTESQDEPTEARLDCLVFVTIYISFALSGLVDIFIFYSSTSSLLPKQSDGLILTICFLIETLLVYFTEQDRCLLSIILCCLVVSVLKLVHTTTILTFSLVIFTMVQGTWLLHSSFLPTSDSMTNLYFSWHILAVFIITTALNITFHLFFRQERKTQTPSTSTRVTTASSLNISTPSPVTINNPTGLTVKINHDALARSKLNKSEDNLSKESSSKVAASVISDSEDNTSFASVPTQLVSVVDSEHCERVSPLEEFNTLHRHCEGVRKSIKLKESSIV